MNGGDIRAGNLGKLYTERGAAFGSGVRRVDGADQLPPQFLLHLRRRLFGESDGEDLLHVRPLLDQADDLFDHHGRFSAPRRGGNDGPAARLYRFKLFFGKAVHFFVPPSPSFLRRAMSAIAAGVMPLSERASARS